MSFQPVSRTNTVMMPPKAPIWRKPSTAPIKDISGTVVRKEGEYSVIKVIEEKMKQISITTEVEEVKDDGPKTPEFGKYEDCWDE